MKNKVYFFSKINNFLLKCMPYIFPTIIGITILLKYRLIKERFIEIIGYDFNDFEVGIILIIFESLITLSFKMLFKYIEKLKNISSFFKHKLYSWLRPILNKIKHKTFRILGNKSINSFYYINYIPTPEQKQIKEYISSIQSLNILICITLPKTIPIENLKSILKFAYLQLDNAKSNYQYKSTLRNAIIIELLFSTGMRVSEISNLKRKSLDLNSNTIYIYGKGSKERIMCIANVKVSRLLNEYIKICGGKNEYVFINKLGNRYSEQSIRHMINDYAKRSDVGLHITPHMFRHTFATALMDENVNIRYIQQLLGHSSITTTQIYTHISTNKIRHILEENHPRNKMNI